MGAPLHASIREGRDAALNEPNDRIYYFVAAMTAINGTSTPTDLTAELVAIVNWHPPLQRDFLQRSVTNPTLIQRNAGRFEHLRQCPPVPCHEYHFQDFAVIEATANFV